MIKCNLCLFLLEKRLSGNKLPVKTSLRGFLQSCFIILPSARNFVCFIVLCSVKCLWYLWVAGGTLFLQKTLIFETSPKQLVTYHITGVTSDFHLLIPESPKLACFIKFKICSAWLSTVQRMQVVTHYLDHYAKK